MEVVTLPCPAAGQPVPPRPRRRAGPGGRPAARPRARRAGAAEAGVEIVAVADTHVHNDYVSGPRPGPPARRRLPPRGRRVRRAPRDVGVRDGDVLPVGALRVEVIDSPGHTATTSRSSSTGHGPPALCPAEPAPRHRRAHRPGLPRAHAGARARPVGLGPPLASLPPSTPLLPTHGFGSFCAARHPRPRRPGHRRSAARHQPRPHHQTARTSSPSWSRATAPSRPTTPTWPRSTGPAPAGAARPARPATAEQVTDAVLAGAVGHRRSRPRPASPPATSPAPSASSTPTSSRRTSAGWCHGRTTSCCWRTTHASTPPCRTWPASGSKVSRPTPCAADTAAGDLPPGRLGGLARCRGPAGALDVRRRRRVRGRAPPGAVNVPLHELDNGRSTSRPARCGSTAAPASGPGSPPASCSERPRRRAPRRRVDPRARAAAPVRRPRPPDLSDHVLGRSPRVTHDTTARHHHSDRRSWGRPEVKTCCR